MIGRRKQKGRRFILKDELSATEFRCIHCERVVTMDNLGAYANFDDELVVACESWLCIRELQAQGRQHREELHPRVNTGPPRTRPWCWLGVHRWRPYGANERCADCHEKRVTITLSYRD
jgi:hypothetical protein